MKKGFTIVEIIISISIILVVGISTTFFVINKSNDNKVDKVTKEILEAANVFINTELDDKGNSYKNGILSGGKGVQLSVKNLIDKGYIKEEQVRKLNLDEESSYILAATTTNDESICGEGVIEYTPKWITSSEPIYLCGYDYTSSVSSENLTNYILKKYGGDSNIELKNYVTFNSQYIPLPLSGYSYPSASNPDYLYNLYQNDDGSIYMGKLSEYSNGLFKRNTYANENDYTYYYRGNVLDNYLEFQSFSGNMFGVNKSIYRIISFNNNEIRLIVNEAGYGGFWEYSYLESMFYEPCVYGLDETKESNECKIIREFWNKEIFIKTKFCKDYTPDKSINAGFKGECNDFTTSYSGAISEYEAIMAGVFPSIGYEVLENDWFNSSLQQVQVKSTYKQTRGITHSFNWLCENKIETINNYVILADSLTYDTTHYNATMHEDTSGNVKNSPFMYSTESNVNQSDILNFVNGKRGVLAIDPNKITFTGSGTKYDPYVISPK